MQEITAEVLLLDDEEASLELSRRAISRYVPEGSIHLAATAEEAMDILKKTDHSCVPGCGIEKQRWVYPVPIYPSEASRSDGSDSYRTCGSRSEEL